jgi:hypothetical protein
MMPVHIGELSTEVGVEQDTGPAAAAPAVAEPWQREAEWRSVQERLCREAARTAAEGFDD